MNPNPNRQHPDCSKKNSSGSRVLWRRIGYGAFAGLVLLVGCTTATQRHMKKADAALLRSHELSVIPDWNAALAEAREMSDKVRGGIEARPVRPGASGGKVDLRPLLAAFESGPLRQLEVALQAHDAPAAAAAYPVVQSYCIACHLTLGKTEIKISPLVRPTTP